MSVLRRGLGKYILDLDAGCDEVQVICAAEEQRTRPAIIPDGHLDRVLGVEETSVELERLRITRDWVQHGETKAFHFKNGKLAGGFFYAPGRRYRQVLVRAESSGGRGVEMSHAVVASSPLSGLYFGHWLRECLPQVLLAKSLGPAIELFDCRDRYTHSDYADLADLRCPSVARGCFGRLTILEDHHQNSHRVARYREVGRRIREKAGTPNQAPPHGVFLLRGGSGAERRLTNEQQVADHLAGKGFRVIDHASMTPQQLVRAMSGTKVVVAVEGSHIAHAIYTLADPGALMVLQPPARFNNVYKDVCDAMNWSYGTYVCVPDGKGHSFRLDDFDLMDRIIDQTLAAVGQPL